MLARDSEIRQAVQARAVQDTRILQKVNAAHREAFREKFPGQIEHALRLTAERLQAVLTKTETTVLNQPATWSCTAQDIRDLAVALDSLHNIHTELRHDRSSSSNTQSTTLGS
jgi:hypothetical protein